MDEVRPTASVLPQADSATMPNEVIAAEHEATLLREYRAILEHAGLAILFTRDKRIYRCNQRTADIFGWPTEARLLGQSARVLFDSDEAFAQLSRVARPFLATGRIYNTEFDLARLDGTLLKAHIVASAIDPANPRDGAIWIIEDVSRQYEEAIQRARLLREHQMIFDNAMVGIAFQKDRRILRCNAKLEQLFGYTPGEMIGQSTAILYPNQQAWETAGKEVFRDPAAIEHDSERLFARKDGSTMRIHITGRAIGMGEWIWIYQDVTDRYLAKQELVANNRNLESRVEERTRELQSHNHFLGQLLQAMPLGVFYKATDKRYLGCNKTFADWMGVSQSDIVGRLSEDIAPPALAKLYSQTDQQLLDQPGSLAYEGLTQTPDGRQRTMLFHKATFTRPDGTVNGIVGAMLDISERKEMEDRLKLAATVFDSTADGVTLTDAQGNIVAVNRAFTEITGYSEAEVLGKNPRVLQSGLQDAGFYQHLWTTIKNDQRWTGEIWNRRKDGSVFPEQLTITSVKDADGKITNYVGVFSDITKLKSTQDALDFQAHHDALTGLPNRSLLEDRLGMAVQRSRRRNLSFALLFIDLDRFKVINDTLGHHVGDVVLCEVAGRFTSLVRESDTVARLGGDEFVLVLEQIASEGDAARIADKILETLSRPIRAQDQEFFVGASIGISIFPGDADDPVALLKNADAAMYRAKDRGRNTYEFYSQELSTTSIDRFRLEADIRYAIDRDELLLHFQPQFSAQGTLIGGEALVRWKHPERGMISPGHFIPLAEESGLIVPMGEWIMHRACQQWAEWHAAGLKPGVLAINVSGVEFRRGRVRESVEMALAATRLPPELVELEITESSIMNQAENSIQALRDLRHLGVAIAIDDFGTGYSSLAYLKRLPISKLKVDQGFVKELPNGAEDAAIARAIIALAKSLQLKTIAEGVETPAQHAFLIETGCDEMQGYLLGRPISAPDFEALLRQKRAAS